MAEGLEALQALLGIVAPVFLIILLGYGLARRGHVPPAAIASNGRFVLNVLTPAVVFHALAGARIGELARIDYLAVYGLASLLAFAAGYGWFRLGRDPAGGAVAAVRALGMSGSNTAFIGLPILTQVYGPRAAGPIALNMLFESFVLLPLLIALLELAESRDSAAPGRLGRALVGIGHGLLRSSLLWAIVLGTVCAATGWRLPAPLARTVDLLAGASAALALVTIGAGLAGIVLAGRRAAIAAVVAGKLLLHPLLVVALLLIVPIADPVFRTSAVLLAGLPMFSIFPVFGQRAGDGDTCGAAMLVAVMLSPLLLVGTMWALGMHL